MQDSKYRLVVERVVEVKINPKSGVKTIYTNSGHCQVVTMYLHFNLKPGHKCIVVYKDGISFELLTTTIDSELLPFKLVGEEVTDDELLPPIEKINKFKLLLKCLVRKLKKKLSNNVSR